MSTALSQQKRKSASKPAEDLSHNPNYIVIDPPGHLIADKIAEMGIDAAELAKRMEVPAETIERLINVEIPITQEIADKIQEVTGMRATLIMRMELQYKERQKYAKQHPEMPAYFGSININQK